jgi:hypothetical protein
MVDARRQSVPGSADRRALTIRTVIISVIHPDNCESKSTGRSIYPCYRAGGPVSPTTRPRGLLPVGYPRAQIFIELRSTPYINPQIRKSVKHRAAGPVPAHSGSNDCVLQPGTLLVATPLRKDLLMDHEAFRSHMLNGAASTRYVA